MQMRIGGKEVSTSEERWMPVINPANGREIDRVPEGTVYDVEDAVREAEAAFDGWARRTTRERGMVLFRAAETVRKRHRELSSLLTSEQGKPSRDAVDEVRGFANILEFYAEISGSFHGEFIGLGQSGDCWSGMSRRTLRGNHSLNMPAILMGWKVAPALLAGNTMVFKPASLTPLTVLSLAAIMEEAGLPPGVLNVVTGTGEGVGEAIIRHTAIKKISFTGDIETGNRVGELARASLKDVHLELGGSDPMIVWNDADIGKAVEGAIRGRFYNAGQTCTAVKRLYVHEEIGDEFIPVLKQRVEALRVGDGSNPAVDMGPLTGKIPLDRIEALVRETREEKQGKIITGGELLTGTGYKGGFFYEPTLVTEPAPGCPLLREETFGPSFRPRPLLIRDTARRQTRPAMAWGLRYGPGIYPL
jgi:succinate-semialdehyde dehydrogenase/glutarate-semialdehyde dehydrogenase